MHYVFLMIAIVSEVIATTSLKASEEFSRLWPSVVVVVGYCCSFYFLALSLRRITVGAAYAIWCGVGIVLIAIAGKIFYDQSIDFPAALGILLIVSGIVVMYVFSKSVLY